MTLQEDIPEELLSVTGVSLKKILDPTVAESVTLGNVGGGIEEELVVSALVDTPGVLDTGLSQESCCQVDALSIMISS